MYLRIILYDMGKCDAGEICEPSFICATYMDFYYNVWVDQRLAPVLQISCKPGYNKIMVVAQYCRP